jgi:thioredoxin reductase (NADPH)
LIAFFSISNPQSAIGPNFGANPNNGINESQDFCMVSSPFFITPAEIVALAGTNKLEGVVIKKGEETIQKSCDSFIPLFGLAPKLGPIADWGLEIEKNAIKVDNTLDYQTNIPGIYAIGDVNTYPGKLKLILCGFHEATLMCQSAYQRIFPNTKYVLLYFFFGGVEGFDGTKKEAPKAVVKAIN